MRGERERKGIEGREEVDMGSGRAVVEVGCVAG